MTKKELEKGLQKIRKWTGFTNFGNLYNPECEFENSFNYIIPVFLKLQDLFSCGGSIIEDEVEFYTQGYSVHTLICCTQLEDEKFEDTIFRACIEAINLYESNPENFVSRK